MPSRLIGYQAAKAAQTAAYFAMRESGREISKLKLAKLLYLTERESIETRGRPMFYDEYYSIKDGPICTNALNGVDGVWTPPAEKAIWAENVVKKNTKTIAAAHQDPEKLDELSRSDIKILDAIWARFGWMTPSQIRNWTHENCPEYEEVPAGRLPISYQQICEAVGHKNAAELEEHVREHRSLEAIVSRK